MSPTHFNIYQELVNEMALEMMEGVINPPSTQRNIKKVIKNCAHHHILENSLLDVNT